jgi:hypothetical protein
MFLGIRRRMRQQQAKRKYSCNWVLQKDLFLTNPFEVLWERVAQQNSVVVQQKDNNQ